MAMDRMVLSVLGPGQERATVEGCRVRAVCTLLAQCGFLSLIVVSWIRV